MANEARILESYGQNSDGASSRYACNDAVGLPYGTLLQGGHSASGPMASFANAWTLGSSLTSGAFVGILNREKVASDGITELGVTKNCMALLKASGAITAFSVVLCAGNNEVKQYTPTAFSGATASEALYLVASMMVGIAQHTAADGASIKVRINK